MSASDPRQPLLPGLSLFDPETGRPARPVAFVLCLLVAFAVSVWASFDGSLIPAAVRALFILVLAVLLWVTEVVPAFAVGILVIALNVALLGRPQGVFAEDDTDWEQFVGVIGHPLIWLFFGGFVLAAGMERCGLDRRLAIGLLHRIGGRYRSVLFGSMIVTFVLSMFMSNTATTAMMLAVLGPVLRQSGSDARAGKGLSLGIAVAANLGGMGSLIGTPPNAIAVAALARLEQPQTISFLDWLVIGFPPAFTAVLLMGALLAWIYSDPDFEARIEPGERIDHPRPPARWQLDFVSVTLLATVGIWLTSTWHGIPTAAVSFLPIVLLTSTGVLSAEDVRGLPYDILFLMAGGLALGNVVTSTGLADWIVDQLPVEMLSPTGLAFLLAYATVAFSNLMSNTAAANILVPLSVTMAAGFEATAAIAVAIGASCAMCLPVATPPNAMVFATGRIKTSELVRVGLLAGAVVPLIGLAWLWVCQMTVLR